MRVLMVGNLHQHALTLAKIAIQQGAKVRQVITVEDAIAVVQQSGSDIIFADETDVQKLILQLRNLNIPVVGCGVDAKQDGEILYLKLPPQVDAVAALLNSIKPKTNVMQAHDPAMLKVLHLAERIAPSDASVLITGESGTGKEVVARHIQQKSKRAQKPFVCVNCAAIPENLLESELFGHEKGAFTGALARRIGKFEEADGGTLLLDEITEMSPHLQAKLLRAIQERTINRVGGSGSIPIDIRILATSNRDIAQVVKDQTFREDLYFRLNVVTVHVLPLRDRLLDVMPLAKYFMQKYAKSNQLATKLFSKEAEYCLQDYSWPGNVRELENTIHRAVLLSHDIIEVEDLQLPLTTWSKCAIQNMEPSLSPEMVHVL